MVEFAINNSVHASTTHTPFFVNGLRHPRLPTFLKCNSSLRGEGIIRANANSSLTHHVLTTRSLRMTPMSITSTSVKKRKVRARMLLLPRSLILPQCAPSALQPKTASQQMNSYWLAKRLPVSCKIPLLKRGPTKEKRRQEWKSKCSFIQ